MINLLPTTELHKVTGEHRRRVAIVVLIFLMCSTVLALLFIVPSAIVVWSAARGFDEQLVATKTLVDLQRKQGGSSLLTDLQERADLLEEALVQRTPTSVLQEIVPRIPSGVSVRQISYTYKSEGIVVEIIGTAQTRSALIMFGDNLRQSPLLSRVDVPVSSLAKSSDIDFTLQLVLEEPVSLDAYGAPQGADNVSEEESDSSLPTE